MRGPSELREQATRYYAMALMAHERDDIDLAEALTAVAMHLMEQADAADAGQIIPSPSPESSQRVAQQQQQIQPKQDDE
jgi:hypothetical protein